MRHVQQKQRLCASHQFHGVLGEACKSSIERLVGFLCIPDMAFYAVQTMSRCHTAPNWIEEWHSLVGDVG